GDLLLPVSLMAEADVCRRVDYGAVIHDRTRDPAAPAPGFACSAATLPSAGGLSGFGCRLHFFQLGDLLDGLRHGKDPFFAGSRVRGRLSGLVRHPAQTMGTAGLATGMVALAVFCGHVADQLARAPLQPDERCWRVGF